MILDEKATTAWKSRKEVWNAVNSSIITARLKLDASCVGIKDMRSRYEGASCLSYLSMPLLTELQC